MGWPNGAQGSSPSSFLQQTFGSLLSHSHRLRTPSPRTSIIAILILIIVFASLDRRISPRIQYGYPGARPGIGRWPASQASPLQDPEVVSFWKDFSKTLNLVKPQAAPIKRVGDAPAMNEFEFDLDNADGRERFDILEMPPNDLAALTKSHAQMVGELEALSPRVPYEPNTHGVVMSAGGRYFGMAITSVRMLRRSGSQLPVEVFLDTWSDYDITTCERILPALNARCIVLAELWSSTPAAPVLEKYQFKVFALLFSSFENILFLDADAFPAHNPDGMFHAEPFASRGLITWPDFWGSSVSPHFYAIAGMPAPPLSARRSSESGIMLASKTRHASTLLLAAYYNVFGPPFFYPLLSQGASGEGDKETFLHAALALGKPFYDVKTAVTVMGTSVNGSWHSAGMKQADPSEDYILSEELGARMKTAQASKVGEAARPMFIHNNIVKLDARHLFEGDGGEAKFVNATGSRLRLWGDQDGVEAMFGYDVERVLWEEVVGAACEIGGDGCARVRSYFNEVFGAR